MSEYELHIDVPSEWVDRVPWRDSTRDTLTIDLLMKGLRLVGEVQYEKESEADGWTQWRVWVEAEPSPSVPPPS